MLVRMRGSRRPDDTREDPAWIRIQGRTNARLLLLSRELKAEFLAPSNWDAFAAVRGELSGCQFELRVERDTSDVARTGAIRHVLELDLQQGAPLRRTATRS